MTAESEAKEDSDLCALLCGEKGKSACGRCGKVKYCSRDHQRKHWKLRHREECQPFKVEEDKDVGRHLVSTCALPRGSLLFSRRPLVQGPPIRQPRPICLRCHSDLRPGSGVRCQGCGSVLCSKRCSSNKDKGFHSLDECEILSKCFGENPQSPAPPFLGAVLPLRMLLLKKSDPEGSAKLEQLQDHVEDLKKINSDWWPQQVDSAVVSPLSRSFPPEAAEAACGRILTNGFQVRGGEGAGGGGGSLSLVGLFDTAYLMNHSCVGNVRLVLDGDGSMRAFAATDIPKGRPLLFNYVSALDPLPERRRALTEFKCFQCRCQRCKDKTDLGTFVGATLCQGCRSGPCCPEGDGGGSRIVPSPCSKCGRLPLRAEAERAEGAKEEAKMRMARGIRSEKEARSMLAELQKHLWPTHSTVLEAKMTLLRILSASASAAPPREENLQERIKMGKEVLAVLDLLDPGLTVQRGLLLFELHSAEVGLANLEFEVAVEAAAAAGGGQDHDDGNGEAASRLLRDLNRALLRLREAEECLALEEPTSRRGQGQGRDLPKTASPLLQHLAAVREAKKEVQDYISMVEHLVQEAI